MHSLQLFLSNHNLHHYYDAFIQTGATDQDLAQFLHFSNDELTELINAVEMLPFHAIKLKRALRELRYKDTEKTPHVLLPISNNETACDESTPAAKEQTTSFNVKTSTLASRSTVLSHAIIYGKNNTRSLTAYEKAINQASIDLAIQDPTLLIQKGQLFELAKKKLLDQGYQYKRGRSRSKLMPSAQNVRKESKRLNREQRAENRSDSRRHDISCLENDRCILSAQIKDKEEQWNRIHDPGNGNALEIELESLKDRQKLLTRMIGELKAQERKHQWYKRRKADLSDSGTSEGEDCPSPPASQDEDQQDNYQESSDRPPPLESSLFPCITLPLPIIGTNTSQDNQHKDRVRRQVGRQWIAPQESDVRDQAITLYHRSLLNG